MPSTYNNLYLDARRAIRDAGIDNAQVEARELICHAARKSKEEFLRDLPLYAPSYVEQNLINLISRRLTGEPVAYLLGEWEFYGLTLEITPDVLIPRPDTELLAERAIIIAQTFENGARILDLCTGSGCVGLAIAAEVPNCRVVLVDISPAALDLTKRNIRKTNLCSRVNCLSGNALDTADAALGHFDLIVCNPPYIPSHVIPTLAPSVRNFEPTLALDGGFDGLDFYRSVLLHWSTALRPGGCLFFEVGIAQSDPVARLMLEYGYQNVRAYRDAAGIPRVVAAETPESFKI
ncbi:MAG: peptide chain release factor N(5)-glutamine methyltransferase [Evtepia sp.]